MAETGSKGSADASTTAPPAWLRSVALWVGAGLAVALLVVLGIAVLPSWWASLIGGWVDGVQSRGILLGLVLGIVFTLLPLAVGVLAMRSGLSAGARTALVVTALLLLLPSVLTIAIWLGSSDARSVLVIEAPGFRGGTVIGIGLVVVGLALILIGRSRARRTHRKIEKAEGQAVARSREIRQAAQHAEPGAGHPADPELDAGQPAEPEPVAAQPTDSEPSQTRPEPEAPDTEESPTRSE